MAITDELTYSSYTQCVANGFKVIRGIIPLADVVGCGYVSNDVARSEESIDSSVLNIITNQQAEAWYYCTTRATYNGQKDSDSEIHESKVEESVESHPKTQKAKDSSCKETECLQ